MRIFTLTMAAILITSAMLFAQKGPKYVQPKQNDVGLYANETRSVNENAIKKVGLEDRLKVLDARKNHFKVKADDGTVGWIETRMVASASGKAFMFDDAEVIGYLDNPTPVYIIDADSKDATPIRLDRSFAEALRENVDRETVERQAR